MALFGRKKKREEREEREERTDVRSVAEARAEKRESTRQKAPAEGPQTPLPGLGPWDSKDALPAEPYVDLGALKLPYIKDITLTLSADGAPGEFTGVTAAYGRSALQLTVFAAPRNTDLWPALAPALLAESAHAMTRDGEFGQEVWCDIPTEDGFIPGRIIGVDGDRWMLRGIFTGPAARETIDQTILNRYLRSIVVDRGTTPYSPQAPIQLTFPEVSTDSGESEGEGVPDRGPTAYSHDVDVRSRREAEQILRRGQLSSEIR